MASAMIKGVAFQSVAADVNRLRQAGVISEADLRAAIKPEEAKYLSEPVVPGLWYPLGTYGRLLDLLCRKEGNDRSEYLIERMDEAFLKAVHEKEKPEGADGR